MLSSKHTHTCRPIRVLTVPTLFYNIPSVLVLLQEAFSWLLLSGNSPTFFVSQLGTCPYCLFLRTAELNMDMSSSWRLAGKDYLWTIHGLSMDYPWYKFDFYSGSWAIAPSCWFKTHASIVPLRWFEIREEGVGENIHIPDNWVATSCFSCIRKFTPCNVPLELRQ